MGEISVKQNPDILNNSQLSFDERQKELEQKKQEEDERAKKEHKSPFAKFYQINKKHSDDLQWLVKENSNAYRILLFMFDHMDMYNALVCSYKVLQEGLEISESTVKRSIKLLKEKHFIYVYKTGVSNVYVVNKDLAWSSWGNNTKYCEFPANLILSASEQGRNENSSKKIKTKRLQTIQLKEESTE